MKILHIDCSPRLASHSRRLSAAIIERIRTYAPTSVVTKRDIGLFPLPHLSHDYALALSTPANIAAPPRNAFELSEILIQEVERTDIIVIGTPVNNYTVPSTLKAWIDQILRVDRTFTSVSNGKIGTLRDRPVLVGVAAGGQLTGEQSNQPDFLTPYLSAALASVGLHTVRYALVEKTAFISWEDVSSATNQALLDFDFTVLENLVPVGH